MLIAGVVLLHDNEYLHTSTTAHTRALLEHFNWEGEFDHSPYYSPDLTPNYYHLFAYLKSWSRSQRFHNEDLIESVKTWLSSQAAYFFDTGKQELISQYHKCLNSSSDYTEKYLM
jgi:transposase